jgi:serine/threonine protein kinase
MGDRRLRHGQDRRLWPGGSHRSTKTDWAGMMVGTVSYMPPEQAMGGQVTAKSRPIFPGGHAVGHHINTPPVSPTWKRPDLPPALEVLIMQLPEKDPEKRPQSTSVVLQGLDSIGSSKTSQEPMLGLR